MNPEYVTLLGILAQTIVWLLGGYAMVIRNGESNKALKEEIDGIQAELKALSIVVTQMAVQTVRLDNIHDRVNLIDRRVEDLRRGHGWITGVKGEREHP